jgi:hypothetical protein
MVRPPYNNRFNPTQRGRHALCSGRSIRVGLTAKAAPEPPSACPFQARQKGLQLRGLIERYGRNKLLLGTKNQIENGAPRRVTLSKNTR